MDTPLDDPPPEHDVVLKCKNGKRKLPTGDIYVLFRISTGMNADVIAYSWDPDFGKKFIEQIACKEIFGKFWDPKDGSPCFDPFNDDGSRRPIPNGKILIWDESTTELDFDDQGMPIDPCPTLYVFDDKEPVCKYKMQRATVTIHDYVSIETQGDKFFNKK
jgi:hypothetical protein